MRRLLRRALVLLLAALIAALCGCGGGKEEGSGMPGSSSSSRFSYGGPEKASFAEGDKILGGVVCDFINRKYWLNGINWKIRDPLKFLVANGMNWVRVGVTMQSCPELAETPVEGWQNLDWKSGYWSSREYAGRILVEAEALNMKKCLFLFLSPEAAHGGVQKMPEEWEGKPVEEVAPLLKAYCYETAKYYRDKGIDIDIYELGNEIERGILGYRPTEKIELPAGVNLLTNTSYMRENVWHIEAGLLKAAAEGVRQADPDAVIGLHAAGVGYSPGEVLVTGFFKAMCDFGVDFDIAGLSYYWDSPLSSFERSPYYTYDAFGALVEYLGKTLQKKVLISEWAYPLSTVGAEAKVRDQGYPFTPEGQAAWVRDFLKYCDDNQYIIGSFYFYPDYYDGAMDGATPFLESCGLFIDQFTPAPALKEYGKYIGK